MFIGLTATAIPPAFQVPSMAMMNCGTFCRNNATRSPAEKSRLGERRGERAGQLIQLAPGQHAVEVADDRRAGSRWTQALNIASALANSTSMSLGWPASYRASQGRSS